MQDISTSPQDAAAHWAASFLQTLLYGWLSATDTPSGLFYPYLNRTWQPQGHRALTLVTQCRLIYNFSRGAEVFGDASFAAAASRGLAALERDFRLERGQYRWAVHPDGTEADPQPDAYGHAFCLLALATAGPILREPRWVAAAWDLWERMIVLFRDRLGGLTWHPDQPQAARQRSQNPMMHGFEALLALHTADRSGRALAEAEKMLSFLRTLSDFSDGRLIERFDPDWQPLPVEQGGVIDLGHQFEWALLLSDWNAATADSAALHQGGLFLQTGLRHGMDTDGGVWASAAPPAGPVLSRSKGLWQQCEALRALRRYAIRHDHSEAERVMTRSLEFYRRHFIDPEHGGLFAQPPGLGGSPRLEKGNAWKLDYHSVNMCLEMIAERRSAAADRYAPFANAWNGKVL